MHSNPEIAVIHNFATPNELQKIKDGARGHMKRLLDISTLEISTQDFSTPEVSTMNPSAMNSSTMNSSTMNSSTKNS
jgi:hypothetical protein